MTSSHQIVDYVGVGTLDERPTPPPVASSALALYLAVDVGNLSAWFIDHWATIINFGDAPPTPPTTTTGFLLEDGSGLLVLEDSSGFLIQES